MARDKKQPRQPSAVPAATTAALARNYKKNLRSRRSQQRRAEAARKYQSKIDFDPNVRRTLRKTAREALRKQINARNVRPWVSENPAYRLQDKEYPAASLLGLPKELRQKILYMRYPLPENDEPAISYFAKGKRADRWRTLCERIGELCCVSPLLRMDMEYVGAQWKEELQKEEEAKKTDLFGWETFDLTALGERLASKRELAKQKVVKVRRGKKYSTRSRPPKCWYCEGRHPQGGKYIALHPQVRYC